MNPLNAALDRMGVEPSERAIFSWAGLCLGLLGGASIALANTAETLFLKRVGVEYLPLALLGSSLLLVGTTAWLGSFLARRDRPSWLPRILFLLALSIFLILGGHRVMLAALINSFASVPLGGFAIDANLFNLVVGVTSAASTPDDLVQEIVEYFRTLNPSLALIEEGEWEDITFRKPKRVPAL